MERRTPLASFRLELLSEARTLRGQERRGELSSSRIAYLRGVLARQRGQTDLAISYLRHALYLGESTAPLLNDLGDLLTARVRPAESIAAHLRALQAASTDAVRYARLADGLVRHGHPREAVAVLKFGLALHPDDLTLLGDLGDLLRLQGRPQEARASYQAASRSAPFASRFLVGMARTTLDTGDYVNALKEFEHGLEIHRRDVELMAGRAEALVRLNRIDEALRTLESALDINPRHLQSIRLLTLTLELLGQRQYAASAWTTLGAAHEQHSNHREASIAYRSALTRKPGSVRAAIGLGRTSMALGRISDAIDAFTSAVEAAPHIAAAHVERGRTLFCTGRHQTAWDDLSSHHSTNLPRWPRCEQPVWDGSFLDGRTVLLWADATLSDTVLFLRYAQYAKARGGRVIVECDAALVPLADRMPSVDHAIDINGPQRPFDCHAPLLYFPAVVRSARTAAPHVPYLDAGAACRERWRKRLRGDRRMTVGVAWASESGTSAQMQPVHLPSLLVDSRLPADLRLISLQIGPHSDELLPPPYCHRIERVLDAQASLLEVAALMQCVDLVVCADTVFAHLAGALGIPAITVLSSGHRWPWPADADAFAWYPTMRLLRPSAGRRALDLREELESRLHDCRQGGHVLPT